MKRLRRLKIGFAILMILSGLAIIAYPVISNMLAKRHASVVIQNYEDSVQSMDTEKLDAAKEAVRLYNEQLNTVVEQDAKGGAEEAGISYVDMLGLSESLGYISIPKIDVDLPIYEGTGDDVLLKGAGHMSQTSFPLGGENTHSVLTGHRGLADAVLFTDLDKLEKGDVFYLHVLDEVLAYQVDQIKVVEPADTSDLEIIPGGDYCTLVTCTPYAVNTHRLLVRGIRTDYEEEEKESRVQYQALQSGTIIRRYVEVWPWLLLALAGVVGGEGMLLMLLLRRHRIREEDN